MTLSVTFGATARVAAPSVCFAVARILLAAAPTAPPCFRHWRRSSPLPQRGSHWQAGPLPTGRPRPGMTQKGGPCYRGQQLRDNIPCQAVVNLDSGALLFPRHRALLVQAKSDRYAKGSPFGGAGERSETERASPFPKSICTAISTGFCQSDAIAVLFYFSVASFPSQSPSVTALPKGEPFVVRCRKRLLKSALTLSSVRALC